MALPGNGGYDCEFVKNPTSVFQSDCPICLLKLRDPYIVGCCGKSYCKDCIKRAQLQDNQCPACRSQFYIFPNKGLKQSLSQLDVYCSHRKDGCKWKGELGQLDGHLNKIFAPNEEGVGCPFATIKCIHCSNQFPRQHLQKHPFASCPRRILQCKYCNQAYVLGELKQQSNLNPSAENLLERHVIEECPLTVVNCDYHSAGCYVQLPRKDIPAHLAEYVGTHLGLLGTQNSYLSEQVLQKNTLIKKLKLLLVLISAASIVLSLAFLYYIGFPVVKVILTLTLASILIYYTFNAHATSVVPYTVSVCNFKKLRINRTLWYSPPFYTHPQGYKICLKVDANGDGANVSVYVCLMRGEFDDHLKWPFRGDITIQLLNQEGGKDHQARAINFTDRTPDYIAGRQLTTRKKNKGWGKFKFISHCQLNPKYLKNDRLQFRVSKVELKN